MFTADDKQLIASLRQLKGYIYDSFFKNFYREIGHAEDLTACLQRLINMGQQEEFQAVDDHALHARVTLITLLRLKSCWRVATASIRAFVSAGGEHFEHMM